MNTLPAATEIVDAIIRDLKDRRGFRHLWEDIEIEDEEIAEEIRNTWIKLAEEELKRW